MKPARFDYFAPTTLEEALELQAEYGSDAKPLAGGQSLVPAMNFRLAQPSVLVDLNGIESLFGIEPHDEGGTRIAAMTRQRAVEQSPLVAERAPLVAEAIAHVAHPQIRNRGTFGGSLVHADPAAELPAVALCLRMVMRVQGKRGERLVPAEEFFHGLFETALQGDELLTEVLVPALPTRTGTAFEEVARRHGDYALAGACAYVTLDEHGRIAESRLVYLSLGDQPVETTSAARLVQGERPSPALFEEAAQAIRQDIDPIGDIHAPAGYRRHLAQVLAKRTLSRAAERAGLAATSKRSQPGT